MAKEHMELPPGQSHQAARRVELLLPLCQIQRLRDFLTTGQPHWPLNCGLAKKVNPLILQTPVILFFSQMSIYERNILSKPNSLGFMWLASSLINCKSERLRLMLFHLTGQVAIQEVPPTHPQEVLQNNQRTVRLKRVSLIV